jgi:hypothetical protein
LYLIIQILGYIFLKAYLSVIYKMGDKSRHNCNRSCKDYWACQDEGGGEGYNELSMRGKPEEATSGQGGEITLQEEVRKIVHAGANVYNEPGWNGIKEFTTWRDKQKGRASIIAKLFYEAIVIKRNRSPPPVYYIGKSLEETLCEEISNHRNLQQAS